MSDNRTGWYEKGRLFKKQKDYSNAIVCFQSMLKSSPNDLLALNELYKCYLLVGRIKEGIDAVNSLMRTYVAGNKKMEALTVYGELMQLQSGHTFDQNDQITLVDWLVDVKDFAAAVIALDNYSRRYPHDKRVPDLLLRAARLCQNKLDDVKRTQQYVDLIIAQYPDSRAAGEAALLFFDTKV